MKILRALFRLLWLCLATILSYLLFLAGTLAAKAAGHDPWRWRNTIVQFWARALLKVMGIHRHVRGSVPTGPSYIVSNHLSYMDIPLLFSYVGCIFVAKAELRHWPVFGFLTRSVGTIFVDRTSKKDVIRVNALIERAVREGKSILIFPEGTTSAGNDVLPFKPSLLEFAAQYRLPVTCATVHYAIPDPAPPVNEAVCWWGDMTFPGHFFNLLKIRRIDAAVEFAQSDSLSADRKELAQELWTKVKQIFVPVAI